MKKIILVLLITLTTLMANFVMKNDGTLTPTTDTQVTATTEPAATTKQARYTVIPGLYSFGTDTRAAYGGTVDPKILHVNTLVAGISNTDSTHGSFEWCLTQKYPRIVVFDVSGIIQGRDGTKGAPLIIKDPYITIAGQTAPDNIIYNGVLWVNTSNVLIQHLAVRARSTNDELDAILILSDKNSGAINNIVLDHCSGTWGLDEQISVSSAVGGDSVDNVTISNCIIAESIYDVHPTGSLNYGASGTDRIAHVHNLYASNSMRSPLFTRWITGAVYNNIQYNWRHSVSMLAGSLNNTVSDSADIHFSFCGNHAIEGPDTTTNTKANTLVRILNSIDVTKPNVSLELYMSDNLKYGNTPVSGYDVWDDNGHGYNKMTQAIDNNGYVIQPASETENYVLSNVGPRPNNRDSVDSRIVSGVANRTLTMQTSFPSLPAEPKLTSAFVPVSNPHDMYNSNYTNLEHQLHQLAAAVESAK